MTTMVSFRVEDDDVLRVDEWARRLNVDRTTLLRDAVAAYLARLAGEHDAAAYQRQPLTDEELALADAEDWGPAEDWSDLAAWLDERDAKG
ncbi:MAG TPA: ribbon-helix-helix protein, CopG family [Acidimicrobiales bacterium]|nr:ribbon-helix-helix protein, CopG family [Acidimicrobiales bacterium]